MYFEPYDGMSVAIESDVGKLASSADLAMLSECGIAWIGQPAVNQTSGPSFDGLPCP